MTNDPLAILGYQGERQIAVRSEPFDDTHFAAVAMRRICKRRLCDHADRRMVARFLRADRDGGHSKCPDRSRLVAR